MLDVLLNWRLGSRFGWGLLGLNVFSHWANDSRVRPLMGQPITLSDVEGLDPLRLLRMLAAVAYSNRILQESSGAGLGPSEAVQIDAIGNDFLPAIERRSKIMIARVVFESGEAALARERLAHYDRLLTASTWNARRLKEWTGREVHVIPEGIDESLFVPGPRSGLMDERCFYVFSGGKIEYRKAQDLVLLAFRRFASRHADAVLVTAWHSLWPQQARGFRGQLEVPLAVDPRGMPDIPKWARDNGVSPAQFIDLGQVANTSLPTILREMHVALQPSRAEACTSLPVKEAMACEVPVIAAPNTGMLDLLQADNCIPLREQIAPGGGTDPAMGDWGESDIEEIDAALEYVYQNRDAARQIGLRGRQWLLDHGRTWGRHAAALKDWLLKPRA